jgi:hypothetical protein
LLVIKNCFEAMEIGKFYSHFVSFSELTFL